MLDTMTIILAIIYGIIGLVIYHKLFTVYYSRLMYGLASELGSALIGGYFLSVLTIRYWWIIMIVAILIGVAYNFSQKNQG